MFQIRINDWTADTFRFSSGGSLDLGVHSLIVSRDPDWKALTARRAQAFVCNGVVSSLCASAEQAVQHVSARLKAIDGNLGPAQGKIVRTPATGSGRVSPGSCRLAAVFRLGKSVGHI